MKNVLFIIPSLNYGGAELLLLQQVQWLKKNGWSCYVAILSRNNNEELLEKLSLPKEKLIFFESNHSVLHFSALVFAWQHYKKLTSFAKKNNIKNIIAHLPLAHFWGRLVKLKMPFARLLIYHHSMQYQANPLNTVGKKIFNNYQKSLAQKTDDVTICISESVKENIDAYFVLKNSVILYNAVPERDLSKNTEIDRVGREELIKLILPGRLHPAKGHLFFLKVFQQLIGEFRRPLKLVIAGGGGLEKEIKIGRAHV